MKDRYRYTVYGGKTGRNSRYTKWEWDWIWASVYILGLISGAGLVFILIKVL